MSDHRKVESAPYQANNTLGLASNVFTFIDFTCRLIDGSLELYHSKDGATVSHRVLEDVTKDLGNLCEGLAPGQSNIQGSGASDSETALLPLLEPCKKLGDELLTVLEDLKVQSRGKAWKSVRQALKSVWNANKIKKYKEQLDLHRSQFAARLLSLIWERQKSITASQSKTSQAQSKLGAALDELLEKNHRLEINVSEDIAKLRSDIQTSLARCMKCHEPSRIGSSELEVPRELPDWLSKLHKKAFSLQRQVEVISSLHYPRISERERIVKEPHPKTYDWLFEDSKDTNGRRSASNVLDWLRKGKDVFWVSGKAGSGKSVLMKHLYNHQKTRAALRQWAVGKDLVVAGFFFWTAGTLMQKSQQGLLQSLLMCILKQCPALVPHLCPDRWNTRLRTDEGDIWTKSELLEALTRLKSESLRSARICIFIDGLDEYDGELLDLLHLVKGLTTSGSIKICVSSRPWNVFENFFGDNSESKIALQHLNRTDIWRFAYDQLTEGKNRRGNLMDASEYLPLVEEIVERSCGVFLWVFLVVRSLLRGLGNLDTAQELRARLRELPTELEDFFRRILDRGDKVYNKQAARLYLLQLSVTDGDLAAWDLAHFAEEDKLFALRDDVSSRHAKDVRQLDRITRTRVLARCQDLLEFDDKSRVVFDHKSRNYFDYRDHRDHRSGLYFLHRTVKDFLETRNIFDELTKRAGDEFNAHLFICNAILVQMEVVLLQHHKGECNAREVDKTLHVNTKDIMSRFWCHTQQLSETDQLSSALIAAFDLTLCSLYAVSQNCCFCQSLWDKFFEYTCDIVPYHKGWFVDMAVKKGLLKILSLQIDKTKQMLPHNEIWRKPPLEKALIYMRSNDRLSTISDLLERGADPNEMNCENQSVWESYLVQREWPISLQFRKTEVTILELLLSHEADISLLFNKNGRSCKLLTAIASDRTLMETRMGQKLRRRVLEYIIAERPKIPWRLKKRFDELELLMRWRDGPDPRRSIVPMSSKKSVFDIMKEEPCKRRKETPSEPPS
ncbi:MAG: hypothetical protein Q9195_005646 [Heterodermia aff. obscurata]